MKMIPFNCQRSRELGSDIEKWFQSHKLILFSSRVTILHTQTFYGLMKPSIDIWAKRPKG